MRRYLIKYSESGQGQLKNIKYKRNFLNEVAAKDWAELNLEPGTWTVIPYDHDYTPERSTLGRGVDK